MMRLVPQRIQFSANLLSGLSIRRYESFKSCPSYATLKTSDEQKVLQSKGIHILLKQAEDGSIILGDSHEYVSASDESPLGFEISAEINELILSEAKKIVTLDSWELDSNWIGHYLEAKQADVYTKTIDQVIHIVNGIGGKALPPLPDLPMSTFNNYIRFNLARNPTEEQE